MPGENITWTEDNWTIPPEEEWVLDKDILFDRGMEEGETKERG